MCPDSHTRVRAMASLPCQTKGGTCWVRFARPPACAWCGSSNECSMYISAPSGQIVGLYHLHPCTFERRGMAGIVCAECAMVRATDQLREEVGWPAR